MLKMTMQEGDSGTHSTALRAGSGRNDTKAECRDKIYFGMTEAKRHASKRNDNVKKCHWILRYAQNDSAKGRVGRDNVSRTLVLHSRHTLVQHPAQPRLAFSALFPFRVPQNFLLLFPL